MSTIITLEENVGIIYTKVTEKILPSTATLYIPSEKGGGSIEALGSSVLYQDNEDYFLITAGHCLKQDGNVIVSGVLDGRNFHYLKGEIMIDRGFGDKTDIGIIRLSDGSRDACLRNHTFITRNQIINNSGIKDPTTYLVAGFPNSKVLIQHRAKKVEKDLLPYVCQSAEEYYYRKLEFTPYQNLLLHLDRRRSTIWGSGEMSMSPKTKGLSGCGVWYVPDYFVENIETIRPLLSGIFIEYYREFRIAAVTKFEMIAPLLKGLLESKK
jgi:hypothetical protein